MVTHGATSEQVLYFDKDVALRNESHGSTNIAQAVVGFWNTHLWVWAWLPVNALYRAIAFAVCA